MKRSNRCPNASCAATHSASSSALSPYDGNTTGVPPRAVMLSIACEVRVEVEGRRRARRRRTRRPRIRPDPHCASATLEHAPSAWRRRGVGRSRCPCSPPGRDPASTVCVEQRLEAGPVDRAIGGERQQHRGDPEDRRARVGAPAPERGPSRCVITPPRVSAANVASRSNSVVAIAGARSQRDRVPRRGTRRPRTPAGTSPAARSTVSAGTTAVRMHHVGVRAEREGRGSSRRGSHPRATSTIVDAPHGDVALARTGIGVVGRGHVEPFGFPGEREPGLREHELAVGGDAVDPHVPGCAARDRGVDAHARASVTTVRARPRRRPRCAATPSRTRRTPVAGSVTASIESVAAIP